MFSDSELQKTESTLARHRTDLAKLDREYTELHERERHAIDRIRHDTQRDVARIDDRKRNLQREIEREEQHLTARRAELERDFRKQNERH